jgi:hypothetical protein
MLAPIKIVLISSCLLPYPKTEGRFYLSNDYSLEAAEYMMKKYPDTMDINYFMYRSLLEDSK